MSQHLVYFGVNILFPPNIRNKARVSTLTTCIKHCPGSTSQCNKASKGNKRPIDQKGRIKTISTLK